jgi:hypothetical protein
VPKFKKSERSIPNYNKWLIALIVLVALVCLSAALYYAVTFRGEPGYNEQIELFLFTLFISSFVGGMLFAAYLMLLEEYNVGAAFFNYFLMLIEFTIMNLGLTLTEVNGWLAERYSPWWTIILYMFFGMHLFSYPRSLRDSLLALMSHIMFIVLNLNRNPGIESILPLLAKQGYTFAFALTIAGFLMFFKPWIMVRKLPSQKGVAIIFKIYIIVYTLFILIPGLYFLVPGLGNYLQTSSMRLLILSALYFIYTLIRKVMNLTEGLIQFITVEDEDSD